MIKTNNHIPHTWHWLDLHLVITPVIPDDIRTLAPTTHHGWTCGSASWTVSWVEYTCGGFHDVCIGIEGIGGCILYPGWEG